MSDHAPGPAGTNASPTPYPQECDLVLKGGITSGVVYPGAIAEFSRHYVFRQIGGTSAGAIAAAAAAAAQLGCASEANPQAFDELAALPNLLGETDPSGQSRLFRLFRPTAEAAPLFATVTAAAGGGGTAGVRIVVAALRHYPLWAAVGALPALAGAVTSPAATSVPGCLVQILVFGLVLAVGTVLGLLAALLRDACRVLPRQGWGLSSGVWREAGSSAATPPQTAAGRAGTDGAQPANTIEDLHGCDRCGAEDPATLSSWLHDYLNRLAGLPQDTVLTFGHLWLGTGAAPTQTIEPAARKISFKAMTTGLNVQRPFILPFEGQDEQDLYFRENDLLAVLPRAVVGHMVEKALSLPPPDRSEAAAEVAARRSQGFLRLPRAHDLPVLLAVRMSLSFPILLSAVRLFKPDYTRSAPQRLQPLWFSDGGICSNLPVHLFDAPLPVRPTFTIDLVEPLKPDCARTGDVHVATNAQSGSQGPRNYFHEKTGFGGIPAFLMTIVDSARNWVDNGQLRLKGYSERVGSVSVHPDEGGLNLSMPPAAIAALSRRGTDVAQQLHAAFSTPVWLSPQNPAHSNGWERHQWLRLRNQLGALSSYLREIRSALASLELDRQALQNLVDRHPGTDTDEDQDPLQRAALRDLLAALSAVVDDPAIRAVVDKSGGRLGIRPR
jgi:predicted acylesterase/phospholipase RssA